LEALSEFREKIAHSRRVFDNVKSEMSRVVVGHEKLIEEVFMALVCGGHCLLEGVPGLGKTLLVRSLGELLNLSFSRIQFTPDLMPADITGTNVLNEDPSGRKIFDFQSGPVFANIVLADEINRATPKTQSALLEAMQEQSVTVGGEDASAKGSLYGPRDAKSHRDGRDLSLARGANRPFLFQVIGPLPKPC